MPDRIETEEDLAAGLKEVRTLDADIAAVIDGLAEVPLRNRTPGFEGLAEIVISQHVSKASAASTFGLLLGAVVPFEEQVWLDTPQEEIVDTGLSRAKQATITGIAQTIVAGDLHLDRLCGLPPEEAHGKLTALRGVGPWTADVFLLFCGWHSDIFPAGDIALQHAAGWVVGESQKPDERRTREIAARWKPLRGVAARVLYARYAQKKGRDKLPV